MQVNSVGGINARALIRFVFRLPAGLPRRNSSSFFPVPIALIGAMKRTVSPIILLVICAMAVLFIAQEAQAASFDCEKAQTQIEKLICSDRELSMLDSDLNKVYQRALEQSDVKPLAAKEQKRWLKKVRNTCQDLGCLKTAYQERINKIGTIAGQKLSDGSDNGKAAQTQSAITPKRSTHQKTSLCTPASLCDKVTLMYSGDDSICKPLLKVYQQLWDKNKKDNKYNARSRAHPSFKGYWEDYYPEVFIKAGFVPPPPLRDEQHKSVSTKNSMSGEWATVFYKLSLEPDTAEQTVLLQDYPWFTHGDYSSDIYISKPGEDISTRCSQDYFAQFINDFRETCGLPKHNQLAFATDFNEQGDLLEDAIPRAETLIRKEYFFNKSNTAKEYSLVMFGEVVPVDIGITPVSSIIQRIYLFNNQPIFTARQDGLSLVYRIKNGSQIDDVCYFATNVAKISH